MANPDQIDEVRVWTKSEIDQATGLMMIEWFLSMMTSWWMIQNDSRDFNSSWKKDIQSSDFITLKNWIEIHHVFTKRNHLPVVTVQSQGSFKVNESHSDCFEINHFWTFKFGKKCLIDSRFFFFERFSKNDISLFFYNFEIFSDIIIEVSVLNFVLSPVPNDSNPP